MCKVSSREKEKKWATESEREKEPWNGKWNCTMKLKWKESKKPKTPNCAEYNEMAFCGKFPRIKDNDNIYKDIYLFHHFIVLTNTPP